MKVITENKVTAIVASSEDTNFPDDNLLDKHPKRKWHAASISVSSATLTISVRGACNAIALVGIVADSAAVSITNPNEVSWEAGTSWEVGTSWESSPIDLNIVTEWIDNDAGDSALWVDYGQFNGIADIVITLYRNANSSDIIAAGVLYAGEKGEFSNPQYGFTKGLIDSSIIAELSNGSTYYKQRDIFRTFKGALFAEYDDLHAYVDIARELGKNPLMWSFVDDADDTEWILYGRFSTMPTAAFTSPQHGETSFEIQEVL